MGFYDELRIILGLSGHVVGILLTVWYLWLRLVVVGSQLLLAPFVIYILDETRSAFSFLDLVREACRSYDEANP